MFDFGEKNLVGRAVKSAVGKEANVELQNLERMNV